MPLDSVSAIAVLATATTSLYMTATVGVSVLRHQSPLAIALFCVCIVCVSALGITTFAEHSPGVSRSSLPSLPSLSPNASAGTGASGPGDSGDSGDGEAVLDVPTSFAISNGLVLAASLVMVMSQLYVVRAPVFAVDGRYATTDDAPPLGSAGRLSSSLGSLSASLASSASSLQGSTGSLAGGSTAAIFKRGQVSRRESPWRWVWTYSWWRSTGFMLLGVVVWHAATATPLYARHLLYESIAWTLKYELTTSTADTDAEMAQWSVRMAAWSQWTGGLWITTVLMAELAGLLHSLTIVSKALSNASLVSIDQQSSPKSSRALRAGLSLSGSTATLADRDPPPSKSTSPSTSDPDDVETDTRTNLKSVLRAITVLASLTLVAILFSLLSLALSSGPIPPAMRPSTLAEILHPPDTTASTRVAATASALAGIVYMYICAHGCVRCHLLLRVHGLQMQALAAETRPVPLVAKRGSLYLGSGSGPSKANGVVHDLSAAPPKRRVLTTIRDEDANDRRGSTSDSDDSQPSARRGTPARPFGAHMDLSSI
ncbi:hypothetical protein BC831DRAFT_445146 [Entophlyctis helioformis]|nr:hypothetical protein BC831DRAFT_445146 [Entophlyctis helioformis]